MSESGTGAFKINEPSRPGSHLAIYILIAIVLAIVAPHVAMQFEVGGEIFLRPDVDPPSAGGGLSSSHNLSRMFPSGTMLLGTP